MNNKNERYVIAIEHEGYLRRPPRLRNYFEALYNDNIIDVEIDNLGFTDTIKFIFKNKADCKAVYELLSREFKHLKTACIKIAVPN